MATHVRLWFDPVCPFCWLTSKWLRDVADQRDLVVEWRFISLRILNEGVDYDEHFPDDYEHGHTAGLRMLRIAARVAEEHGAEALDRLHWAFGQTVFEREPYDDVSWLGSHEQVTQALQQADLPADLVETLDDDGWDATVRAQTREALDLTGEDVGTPIIQVGDGRGFFGPVISRVPPVERAGELWDHVVALADFPSFAELKRSLREQPQLPALGADVDPHTGGEEQDWHQGRRPE
jgi:2-hydroxychromene-2-carboxylate isomerase